jgi:dienelactone hydrolase
MAGKEIPIAGKDGTFMGYLTTPTILRIARADGFVPPDAQAKVESSLKDNGQINIYAYGGANHGFCRETDTTHYKADAAELAHERTLELFQKALV